MKSQGLKCIQKDFLLKLTRDKWEEISPKKSFHRTIEWSLVTRNSISLSFSPLLLIIKKKKT